MRSRDKFTTDCSAYGRFMDTYRICDGGHVERSQHAGSLIEELLPAANELAQILEQAPVLSETRTTRSAVTAKER